MRLSWAALLQPHRPAALRNQRDLVALSRAPTRGRPGATDDAKVVSLETPSDASSSDPNSPTHLGRGARPAASAHLRGRDSNRRRRCCPPARSAPTWAGDAPRCTDQRTWAGVAWALAPPGSRGCRGAWRGTTAYAMSRCRAVEGLDLGLAKRCSSPWAGRPSCAVINCTRRAPRGVRHADALHEALLGFLERGSSRRAARGSRAVNQVKSACVPSFRQTP